MSRGFLLRQLAAVSGFAVLAGFSSPPVEAAGNAGILVHKTVDPARVTINPNIGVTLAVDKTTAIPADTLTYTAGVTNPTATFAMGGVINAEAHADADATVAYYWDELEVCASDCGNGMGNPNWKAVATFEAAQPGYTPVTTPALRTGMSLAAAPVARTGVVYPTSGDLILGTQISPSATAAWTYLATVTLSPAQIAVLADPAQVTAMRNVIHMEVTIRNSSAAQPWTDPELFANPFTSTSNPGAIANVTVTFTLPDGTTTQVAATSSLAPGASAGATSKYKVSVPKPHDATTETDADYISRLGKLEGATLTATAVASGAGFSGTVYATSSAVTTNEFVPLVIIDKSGPHSVDAGTTESNPLSLQNIGGADASSLVITDSVPASPNGTVSDTPTSLAPNETGSATAAYPVPASQAEGSLTDTASITWQDANGNPYGPLSSSWTTTVHNVLFGAMLSLAPVTAGPNPTGSSQALTATLVDRHSNPIPNQVVTFTITGANPGTGTATTDASGQAVFSYTGANNGNDTAIAKVSTPGITLTSNTSSISWGKPLQPVVTTQVQGNFYPNPNNSCAFAASGTPSFGQAFPDILFNSDPSVIPHDISTVGPATRPFTDKTVDVNGNFNGLIVAQGNGFQAGNGPLGNFFAAFTGSFVVTQAGDVTFTIIHDDGYVLGVGNGATRVNGDLEGNPPATTAFNNYGVVAAWNQGGNSAGSATVHFPAPGTYPYELDYTECGGGGLQLVLETAKFIAQTDPLSVYVGYADGLRAGGSIFPFPWQGSPGVTFVGGCTFDAGAIRFDNSGDTDITFDKVTVDLGSGGPHFDLWPANMVVPAHGILILTQTGCFNFDTSDFSNAGCGGNNNVLPLVSVTRGGVLKVYTDTGQVLNTHGFDTVCQGNESIPWQRIAGQANTVNVPLPPAVMLDLTPFNIPNAVQGQTVSVSVSALDGAGNPQVNLPVGLHVTGANAQNLTANTNAAGLATFSYPGFNAGTDTLQATAFPGGVQAISNQGTVVWTPPGGSTNNPLGATITNASPADGSVITTPTPITAAFAPPAGQTIDSWSVTSKLQPQGTTVTLATGTGNPPTPLTTLDPTRIVDGTYVLSISATTSGGAVQTITTSMTVIGNLKPGRYVTAYLDMSVPVAGIPMQVVRTYDSTDKSAGDFGVGWRVGIVNFKVASNRTLGAGGWTQYNKSCVLGLCFTAFKNATPRYVTVTFPDQHTEVFDFTPDGGTNLFWSCSPKFNARASTGTTSTLEAVDDSGCSYQGDGNLYGSNGLYSPHRFRLTTKDGQVLLLDSASGLISQMDSFGNAVNVTASGVSSTLGPSTNPTPGPSISFSRDSQGRITDLQGPLTSQHVHYTYSSTVNELQTDTDPNGNTDTYSYDPTTGNLSSVSGPGNAALLAMTYDASGRLTSLSTNGQPPVNIATDPGLHSQTFTDPNGKLTTVVSYDDLGDVVQKDEIVNGQAPLASKFQFDSVGRTTDSVDPAGNETKFVYDAQGNTVSASQANLNRTWSYQGYNSLGEPGELIQPDGSPLLTLTYDQNTGALQSAQAPGQSPATFAYWPNGRLKQQVDRAGRQINYTYDSLGHLASVGDGTNPAVQVSMDAAGLLRSTTDAAGNQVKYDYWPGGQLKSITDGRNDTWQYFYDGLGRLDHIVDPKLATTQYHYNALGQLDQVTDRNNAVTTYAYDVDGNVIRVTRPGNDVVNYTFDARGFLVEADNAVSHVDRVFDAAGRLQSETTCANTGSSLTPCPAPGTAGGGLPVVKLSYQYWPDGQVKQVTSSDTGVTVSYTYDSNGRPLTVSDPANPNSNYAYTYDPLGRISTARLPNGVLNTFTYNLSGDVTGVDATLNGTKVANFDYQVDPVTGRWTQMTDSSGAHSYSYFADGALKSESHPAGAGLPNQTYTYDAAHNRSSGSVASQFDAANRLITDGTYNYTFDAEGDQKTKTPIAGGPGVSYTWNSDHQLTSITYADGTSSTYQYDPFGRRVKAQDPSATTSFVYDGLDVHADYNGQGQLQTAYLPQMESVSGSTASYYLTDGLGTVRNSTNSSGAVIASSAYSAWGIPAAGNSTGNRYTFTGYQYDQASGLMYAGSRYYDPASGRFLSEDPQPSINAYPYAANNPIGNVDVRGEGLFDYAESLLNALGNAECVAGVASAIATSAYSATMSALGGAHITSDQALTAIGIGVGLAVAGCATNIPSKGGRSNIQANRAAGLALEETIARELPKYGFRVLYQRKWVWTGLGARVIDIVAERNGSIVAFEIKQGGSRYLASQIAKDTWMARFGAVIDGVQYDPFPTILIRG